MLGIHQKPIAVDEMIVPPVRGDLKLMSIGFFLDENAPIMWRGPMLHRALEQFLSDVHWGDLDITLLVDMPPGTGDVAMSLGQLLPRAEELVVTTPQPAAQQVAVRAAQMAQKTGMRIVGAVENMSRTGQELFGSGGGQALMNEIGAPLLARIPLDPVLREAADDGVPVLEAAHPTPRPRRRSSSSPRQWPRPAPGRSSRSPSSSVPWRRRGRPRLLALGLEAAATEVSSRTSPTPNDAGRRGTASRAWRGSRRSTSTRQPVRDGSRASPGTSAGAGTGLSAASSSRRSCAFLDEPPEAARVVVVGSASPRASSARGYVGWRRAGWSPR